MSCPRTSPTRSGWFREALRILVVCHCYREANSTIRIISARKANRAEQRQYESR